MADRADRFGGVGRVVQPKPASTSKLKPDSDESDMLSEEGEERVVTATNAASRSRLSGDDDEALVRGLEGAYRRLLGEYAKSGGHNYHGWDHKDDPRNYRGPMFWTEADSVLRFAFALEQEFPRRVHVEFPVVGWTRSDYDPGLDGKQFVDLVVSDLSKFIEDETSQQRFRSHRHEIFVEAKYLPAGCSKRWRHDHVRKVDAIRLDAERLAQHLERGRCRVAALLIVDDDCLFQDNSAGIVWPSPVRRLLVSPRQL